MKRLFVGLLALALLLGSFAGCTGTGEDTASTASHAAVAGADDMTEVQEVVPAGAVPVYADSLRDGTWPVEVACSSSMFRIVACQLTVAQGKITAALTLSSTAYRYLYPGAAAAAAEAPEDALLTGTETADGQTVFTLPVEGLDMGVPCAAYSNRKEMWYDRTLCFMADSLPQEAFADGALVTVQSLGLADGAYTAAVTLAGGSGKASVQSPAALTVSGGVAVARIVWGSDKYDYMLVGGEKLLPLTLEGGSTFEIPVTVFDRPMTVVADTTAMSQPHEVTYTLTFDAASLQPAP